MLRGYILKITGKHPHDFIKRLLSLSVNLYEIKIFKNDVLIKVNELDFKKIKNLKTSYEIEIIAYVGFNLLSYLIKKYYIFVCSLLWGFIVFLIVSNLTFDIDIIHQDENVRNEVKRMVIQEGLIPYHFQVNFKKKEAITKNILLKNKDKIEWLEIEKKGVKYIVHLTLRKIINPSTDILPQNIVAAKDGMIINITASQGEVVKKKYDYVKKGDILITGVIKNGDLFMKNVKALGKVEAEVWYQSQIEMPLYFYDAKETGKKKKVLELSFLHNKYNLFDFFPYKNKSITRKIIFKSSIIPFSISYNEEKEQDVVTNIYTEEEALVYASIKAQETLLASLPKTSEVLFQKTLKIIRKESKIIVDMFFKVKEDITKTNPILEEIKEGE